MRKLHSGARKPLEVGRVEFARSSYGRVEKAVIVGNEHDQIGRCSLSAHRVPDGKRKAEGKRSDDLDHANLPLQISWQRDFMEERPQAGGLNKI